MYEKVANYFNKMHIKNADNQVAYELAQNLLLIIRIYNTKLIYIQINDYIRQVIKLTLWGTTRFPIIELFPKLLCGPCAIFLSIYSGLIDSCNLGE